MTPPPGLTAEEGGSLEVPSDFQQPVLEVTEASLRVHFGSGPRPREREALRNFHHEPGVGSQKRDGARPSAVLIPFVAHPLGLTLLLTRRHHAISAPGQICFPGGRSEGRDRDRRATALRETSEELGIAASAVEVLGELGHYYSHSGHDIVPVVGLVRPPLRLEPDPREVSEVFEFPVSHVFDATHYALRRRTGSARAHYVLEHEGARVTGPTVCILMNLYAELVSGSAGP